MTFDSAPATYTTFTVFRYDSPARWWAFQQMGLAPAQLKNIPGLQFFRLMGSARGPAFSLWPDWSRYVLLSVWQTPQYAGQFFNESSLMQSFREKAAEIWNVQMLPFKAYGLWGGVNPFRFEPSLPPAEAPVAILTRASLRLRSVWQFCRQAPRVAEHIDAHPGMLFSCGIGEQPLLRQATFSIWENLAAMKRFAYSNAEHRQAMRQKAERDWYSEELFARFQIVGTEGTYLGSNPLASLPLSSTPA